MKLPPMIALLTLILALGGALSSYAVNKNTAEQERVPVHKISKSGIGEKVGHVKFEQTKDGVLITPDLKNLDPGLHGFHVHQNPSCKPGQKDGKLTAGAAAGGHLNPDNSGEHEGPYKEGHLGDLPALFVDKDGNATHPVFAPKVELEQLRGHALIIHAGGDTYSEPPKLGGGGERVACGVIGSPELQESA